MDQRKQQVGGDGDALSEARAALLDMKLRQRRAELAQRDRIVPVPRVGMLPVTLQQRYLWFLHQLEPAIPVYNVEFTLRLRGPLDVTALRAALRGLIKRHESLRTRFGSERGVPFQIVDEPGEASLEIDDLTSRPEQVRWEEALELVTEQIRRPFDLSAGPLLRFWLAKLGDDDHLFVIVNHHIISDGWSTGIIMRDLAELYRLARAGQPAELPMPEVAPVDYAVWQQRYLSGEVLDRQLGYWREAVDGLADMDFPTDRQRPSGSPSAQGNDFNYPISAELLQRARDYAGAENVSLLALFVTALFIVLARWTGKDDVAFGSVFSGRTRREIEPVVGFFTNTLVVRAKLTESVTVSDLLHRCNNLMLDLLGKQDVPFGMVVEAVQPERVPGRNPLFQLSFNLLTDEIMQEFRFEGMSVEELLVHVGTSRFDLGFQLHARSDGKPFIWAEYSTALFDQATIERFIEHFLTAVRAVLDHPAQPLALVDILTPAERATLLTQWNPAPIDFGTSDRLLHELVHDHAVRAPEHPAVRFEGADLRYGELDARANRLARLLQDDYHVGPDAVVAFLLQRGMDVPTVELASIKAGGAWLPLDPAHPPARLAFLLEDAAAKVVVTTSALASSLPAGFAAIVLDDEGDQARLASKPGTPPPCAARPDDVAYVIYTSGSTGTPKGVMVPHRAAVNFAGAANELFRITPDDRVLQFANPTFDVSVFDVFAALCWGATCVAAPVWVLHDPGALADLMRREAVTLADIAPAVLALVDDAGLDDLRALFVGIEAFPAELVNRWRTRRRAFHNGYGPTEATVACVDYECPPEPLAAPPPIGRAMANLGAYVVDPHGRLTPTGVPGELCVAGPQLARGYLGQPGMTAERFVPCPFGAPGGRMYRTGDLVRWLAGGQLEFLGRIDRQVKIRGLRVELGEIEHALASFPGVRQVAVVVANASGGPRLDAYVVGDRTGSAIDEAELRQYLAGSLPPHMIPATFTMLAELPLNSSRKLDRSALPDPAAAGDRGVLLPSTPSQRTLAKIWADMLDVPEEKIGQQNNFFTLGGSSLQATQLISRLREEFYIELDPRQLFINPLLHQLADLIDEEMRAGIDDAELQSLQAQVAQLSEEELDRLLEADDG